MTDVQRLRADFPILARQVHGRPLVYLDNAATTQLPAPVLAAVAAARLTLFEETEIMATFGPDRQKGIGYVVKALQRFAAARAE